MNHSPDVGKMVDLLLTLAGRVEAGETTTDLHETILTVLGWRVQPHGWWVSPAGRMATPPRLSSLDATAALQEAALPGWYVREILERLNDPDPSWRWVVALRRAEYCGPGRVHDQTGHGATLHQAWLAALLRAVSTERRDG